MAGAGSRRVVWLEGPPPRRPGWTLFGIPIRINASWFAVAAFVAWTLARGYFPAVYPGLPAPAYWLMGAVSALLLFGCVLLHELGHSLAARSYGIPVACVTLFMFGGVAQIASDPRRPSAELIVALAGPLVSAAIAWLCFAASGAMPVEHGAQLVGYAVIRYLALINVLLLAFNLLPGFPLDGGRVLRAILWAWTGSLRRATRIASAVGVVFSLALLGLGVWVLTRGAWTGGLWYIVLGLFLRNAALASYRRSAGGG